MMITLLAGGINLASVAIANFAALAMATAMQLEPVRNLIEVSPLVGVFFIATIGCITGWILGWVLGFIIGYLNVSPILASLGMMTLIDGSNLLFTGGTVISDFPEAISRFGQGTLLFVPYTMIIFIAVVFAFYLLIDRHRFGLITRFIGSNPIATQYSGVNVAKATCHIYAISGLLAAVAGFVMLSRFNSVNVSYGQSYLLVSILAAVLGGVDPFGGRGKVFVAVLALVVLQLVSSVMNLLALSNHLTLVIWGALLLFGLGVVWLKSPR